MAIKQRTKSLSATENNLSDGFFQLKVLNGKELVDEQFPAFKQRISDAGFESLTPSPLEIFQLNIGKLCNQSCAHCHVDAGPDKKVENMSRETLEKCLNIIKSVPSIHTVDITGGAPEMNPNFRWFVEECSKLGKKGNEPLQFDHHRCQQKNIMICLSFFAKHKVHLVSSLPYFSKSRTDSQRGDGVFDDSIKALKMLNEVGYGIENSGFQLDLVYNPSGAFLPAQDRKLYKLNSNDS